MILDSSLKLQCNWETYNGGRSVLAEDLLLLFGTQIYNVSY